MTLTPESNTPYTLETGHYTGSTPTYEPYEGAYQATGTGTANQYRFTMPDMDYEEKLHVTATFAAAGTYAVAFTDEMRNYANSVYPERVIADVYIDNEQVGVLDSANNYTYVGVHKDDPVKLTVRAAAGATHIATRYVSLKNAGTGANADGVSITRLRTAESEAIADSFSFTMPDYSVNLSGQIARVYPLTGQERTDENHGAVQIYSVAIHPDDPYSTWFSDGEKITVKLVRDTSYLLKPDTLCVTYHIDGDAEAKIAPMKQDTNDTERYWVLIPEGVKISGTTTVSAEFEWRTDITTKPAFDSAIQTYAGAVTREFKRYNNSSGEWETMTADDMKNVPQNTKIRMIVTSVGTTTAPIGTGTVWFDLGNNQYLTDSTRTRQVQTSGDTLTLIDTFEFVMPNSAVSVGCKIGPVYTVTREAATGGTVTIEMADAIRITDSDGSSAYFASGATIVVNAVPDNEHYFQQIKLRVTTSGGVVERSPDRVYGTRYYFDLPTSITGIVSASVAATFTTAEPSTLSVPKTTQYGSLTVLVDGGAASGNVSGNDMIYTVPANVPVTLEYTESNSGVWVSNTGSDDYSIKVTGSEEVAYQYISRSVVPTSNGDRLKTSIVLQMPSNTNYSVEEGAVKDCYLYLTCIADILPQYRNGAVSLAKVNGGTAALLAFTDGEGTTRYPIMAGETITATTTPPDGYSTRVVNYLTYPYSDVDPTANHSETYVYQAGQNGADLRVTFEQTLYYTTDSESTTLTLYGTEGTGRQSITMYANPQISMYSPFADASEIDPYNVKTVILDSTMASVPLASTANWFNNFQNLTTIKVPTSDFSLNMSQFDNALDGFKMFYNCHNSINGSILVGGAGTQWSEDHVDATYARIDGGSSNPGYFTVAD